MALSVIPRDAASSATLPKREITYSVFMPTLKHTLLPSVKHTLKNNNYDYVMSTLEERVLEAILATKMKVPVLADRIGVSVQSVYDWKKGKSLGDMKADNLIELAYLAGYEPRWIRKEKGLKKKSITKEQEAILEVAEHMEPDAKKSWIAIGASLPTIAPTDKGVDTPQSDQIESPPERRIKNIGHIPENRINEIDIRRQMNSGSLLPNKKDQGKRTKK